MRVDDRLLQPESVSQPHGVIHAGDLIDNVGKSGRPIVLVHHVDVHRYSEVVPDDKVLNNEWDYGDARAFYGVPFLNTDNAGHFVGPAQAFLHIEIDAKELRVREFATRDGWQTGDWTPQLWKFALNTTA